MGDMIYLVAGYAVFWVVTFAFIFSMVTRQKNIETELNVLEQMMTEDGE